MMNFPSANSTAAANARWPGSAGGAGPATGPASRAATKASRGYAPRVTEPRRRGRVPKRDLLFVTMQLAIMSRTGVDMANALESVAKQSRNRLLQETLCQVHEDVSNGVAVSEAFSRHPHVFNNTYVAIIAAGEASGKLPDVLNQLAQLERSELRLMGSIRTLLAYPILLATVCLLVLASLVMFVLPNFAGIFVEAEVPLPLLTQILLGFANELRSRFWLWLPLLAGLIAGAVAVSRSPAGRAFWDRFFLHAKLVRDVTRAIVAGRAFRLLATMLDSGVPLVEALGLVQSAIGNSLVQKALADVQDDVLNGRGMATSLMAADVMPETAPGMIGMGEHTGSLALVSRLIGDYFEEEGESRLRTLVALLEPAIVVGMGAVVAVVVLSVMLPMFDLVTLAQQAG